MESIFDVLCVGKTTVDQFLSFNHQTLKYHLDSKTGFLSFKHGEKIDVEEFDFCIGGNATNVAVGLSRIGLSVALCSEIGDDEFGIKIYKELEKENIDRSHILLTKKSPSSFSVILNLKGERTIFIQRILRDHNFDFKSISAKYIFLTSLEKDWRKPYEQVLALCLNKLNKLVFNPGTLQLHEGLDLVLKVLQNTEILFVNKEEAEELVFGHEKRKRNNEVEYIRELLNKLKKMGPKIVVVTNGRHGSHAIDKDGNYFYQGLFSGVTVERTGAGDAYSCGFLGATVLGLPIREAMKWGAINSSSVVEKVGAQAGLLTKKDLEKRLIEGSHYPLKKEESNLRNILSKTLNRFKLS